MPTPTPSPKRPKIRRKARGWVAHSVDLKAGSPKIREMEKQAATRRGFKWATAIIAVICLAVLLKITVREAFLRNPQFALRQIAVRTEGPLTPQRIVRATALTEGANLLTINLREIRARLERLPQVQTVKLHRDYEGVLTIEIGQRRPVAWLECGRLGLAAGKAGASCLVDADGVPFPADSPTDAMYQTLPIIRYEGLSQYAPGVAIPDLQVKSALELLDALHHRFEQGTEEVRMIDIQTPYSMTAVFANKAQVIFGVDDLDLQLARLDRVRHEARQRQWEIETLNLLVRQNVPVTFRSPPDLAGLQSPQTAVPIAVPVRQTSKTTR